MSVNSKMTAIADAIREKTGSTEQLTLDDMAGSIIGLQCIKKKGGAVTTPASSAYATVECGFSPDIVILTYRDIYKIAVDLTGFYNNPATAIEVKNGSQDLMQNMLINVKPTSTGFSINTRRITGSTVEAKIYYTEQSYTFNYDAIRFV